MKKNSDSVIFSPKNALPRRTYEAPQVKSLDDTVPETGNNTTIPENDGGMFSLS